MTKLRMNKVGKALILAVLVAGVLVGTALAWTIVVDGTRESTWMIGGANGPGIQADQDETGINNNGVDLSLFGWTNDVTYYYFLIETYSTTTWIQAPPRPQIVICLDTDNNVGTGSFYNNCNDMSGIDRYITLNQGTVPPGVTVYDSSFSTQISTTPLVSSTNNVTELGILNTALGFDGSNCGLVPLAVYFDGGNTDIDDNVPNSGQLTGTCGPPTAVTLSDISARPQTNSALLFVAVGLLLLVGAGWTFRRVRVR